MVRCKNEAGALAKYLIKQRRVWYATMEIPKALRPQFGKSRFKQTLQTESLTVAEHKVLRLVADWQQLIAQARINDGSFDGQLAEWRTKEAELRRKGVPDHDIEEALFEIATSLHPNPDEGVELYRAARGHAIVLKEHIEGYLAILKDTSKTIDMKRADLKRFTKKFRLAEDVNKKSLIGWVETTLISGEGLSINTCKRIISACRGYWEYLERHKNLDIPSPFDGILPNQTRTKQTTREKRKAFSPRDYEKLLKASLIDDKPLADLIQLGAYTGCRIEELCSLLINNVDEKRFRISDAKTKAGWRTIPIHDHIKGLVSELKSGSEDGYLLSGLTYNKYGDRSNAIGKRFGRLKSKCGYDSSFVFHSFRKGVATQFEAALIPENIAARILGHGIYTMSYGVYSDGNIPFKTLSKAISKIDWS